MGWKKIKISDLGEILTGNTPPTSDRSYYGEEYTFIKPTDMIAGKRFVPFTGERFSQKAYKKYKKYLLPEFTTVVVTIGTIGKVCLTKELSFTNQATNAIIVSEGNFDKQFIYYLMVYNNPQVKYLSSGTASGRENVSKGVFENIKVSVPPLPTQKKIARILSTYDDLIENNQKRITILEQLAQNLYREWFVRLRFPGWEEAEMVDGLPKGWEKVDFTDISHILNGGTPSTKKANYWNGNIPFFSPRDTNNSYFCFTTEKSITDVGLSNCSSKLFAEDTIFITARGTVGKLVLNAVPMAMNQSNYALLGKNGISQYYLFLTTQLLVERLQKQANGATFSAITVKDFESLTVLKPQKQILEKFDKITKPLFRSIKTLETKNQVLQQTRDRLLPRLLGGKLVV